MVLTASRYWVPFGRRVKQAREAAGLTQTELGGQLGLSRASVTNIEAGRQQVTADRLIDLGRVVRVDPGWLLRGDPPASTLTPAPTTIAELLRARRAVERLLRAHADAFARDAERLLQLATDLNHT